MVVMDTPQKRAEKYAALSHSYFQTSQNPDLNPEAVLYLQNQAANHLSAALHIMPYQEAYSAQYAYIQTHIRHSQKRYDMRLTMYAYEQP